MNGILIKTLNILSKNIEKYNVVVYNYVNDLYELHYVYDSLSYDITIGDRICFRVSSNNYSIGKSIESEFKDDVTKAEIIFLIEKLKSACEDYTSTKFRLFVNNENTDNNGIDD